MQLLLGAATAPLVWAARSTSARTRAARHATATSLRDLASVAAWVAEPAITLDPTRADVTSALTASAGRAIHASCFASAHAMLLVANLLLYAYYTDARDAADAARDSERRNGWACPTSPRPARLRRRSEPPG